MKISEVIQEIRKKLGDFDRIEYSLSVQKILNSIRDALGDREIYGTYSLQKLIEELKNANGESNDTSFTLTAERVLADVRDRLGDNDSNVSFSYPVARLIEELRESLGDSKDGELDPDSLTAKVREKLDGNGAADTGSVAKASVLVNVRLNLNDSVPPYRWETEQLNEYIDSGCDTIRYRRKDVGSSGPGVRFEAAVTAYTTARAFEHEAEDQSDASRCQFYWKKFEEELQNAPFAWTDSELSGYLSEGVQAVRNRRYAETVGTRYEQCVISFALMRAYERSREIVGHEEKYQHYLAKFESDLKSTPSAREDSEYRETIEDGVREVIRRRPDCKDTIYAASSVNLLNERLVSAISAWALFELKGRVADEGSKNELERFYTELNRIPFHWQDTDLQHYLDEGVNLIREEFIHFEPAVTDGVLPVGDRYSMLLESHILSRAYEHALSFADYGEKYKLHRERFEAERERAGKSYAESEYRRIILDAASELTGEPLNESTIDDILPIDERHVPSILHYALYRFALRAGNFAAAGDFLKQYLELKSELPKHWSDEELTGFLNSAIREVIRRRPDCKESEYTEKAMEGGTIPISDKFETSLISYSVIRALEGSGKRDVTEQHQYHVKKYEAGLSAIPFHRNDMELVGYINLGIREIFRLRPDLRLDKDGFPLKRPEDATSPDGEFMLPDVLLPAVVAYSAARCIDEDKRDKDRIVLFSKEFNQLVKGEK